MKGYLFTPLLGVVLLSLSILFLSSFGSLENTFSNIVKAGQESYVLVSTGQLSSYDVLTTIMSSAREKVLERLFRSKVSEAYRYLDYQLAKDLEAALKNNREVKLLRGSISSKVVKKLSPNYVEVEIDLNNVEIEINKASIRGTVFLSGALKFFVPFPLKEEEEINDITLKIEKVIEEYFHSWEGGKCIDLHKKIEKIKENEGKKGKELNVYIIGREVKGYKIEAEINDSSVDVDIDELNVVGYIDRVVVVMRKLWKVPGTGKEIKIRLESSLEQNVSINGIPVKVHVNLKTGKKEVRFSRCITIDRCVRNSILDCICNKNTFMFPGKHLLCSKSHP